MKAIIDSDVLVYKIGFSSERTFYRFVGINGSVIDYEETTIGQVKKDLKDRLLTHSDGKLQKLIRPIPIEFCMQRCRMLIEAILDKTGADSYQLYLTSNDKSNYRFQIAKTKEYKGNRKNSKKPYYYDQLREYMIKYWDAEVVYNQEADDAMGIAQMKSGGNSIICSIDKDMNMIPGYHYDLDTEEIYIATDPGELMLSDERNKLAGRGLKWFYAQMLLGDTADNIPGISGFGPVSTFDLLEKLSTEDEFKEAIKKVYKEYYKAKYEVVYKEVANLLWIRRNEGEMKE